ncbi:sensor histidine kinase [Vallitalea okinawensis]|uniref:sensor histidine kinase n=1 Tax=Vallitalea okinawensis TaxID=2078660 RepID=UPI000CFD157A|nr:HAMP domain-containing sensor histidine kinase [Vallitalea okinawensis]
MNSIRKKLFLQIGALIILLIGLLILANTYLLQHYYINKQKTQLIDYYDQINNLSVSQYEDNLRDFISYENKSNVDILIFNEDDGIIYSSKSYLLDDKMKNKLGVKPPPNEKALERPPIEIKREEPINEKIKFILGVDYITKEDDLILTGDLDNGNIIDLHIPLISIKTSIALANEFLIIVGTIVFIIAMLFAYVVSRTFTRPILEMNKATLGMKNLDFGIQCKVESNDELGQLAQSINEMSAELDDTIQSLHFSNLELQQEIKEKIKIDEKRKQLLNNVSHELKTPLALMQGYAEGLKLNVAKNHNRVDFYCDVIVDEAKKMNYLVQNLLNINQFEIGDEILHKSEFEVVDFVNYIVEKYTPLLCENNINLQLSLPEPTNVYADSFRSEQVLTNYLNNAIQYVDEKKDVHITLLKSDRKVRIEVYNSCQHINDLELEKLWDSFYKRDKARTRDNGGHGLGLSIVKAIQEASHNNYGVRSENNGITFWFELDLQEPHY